MLYTGHQLESMPDPEWLVPQLIEEESLVLLYGPKAVNKSFIAYDLTASVAAGIGWLGYQPKQGPVVYNLGEGGKHFKRRTKAWRLHRNNGVHPPVFFDDTIIDIRDPGDVQRKIEAWREVKPELVVIDTLNRALQGGDENSSDVMGLVVIQLEHLKRELESCIVIVHHTGKDETRGARGHSALAAAVDTVVRVEKSDPETRALQWEHQRNAECPEEPIEVQLQERHGSLVVSKLSAWKMAPRERRILEVVKGADTPMNGDEIVELAKVSRNRGLRTIRDMVAQGVLVRRREGRNVFVELAESNGDADE